MKQLSALGARRHAFFRSPRRMRPLGSRLDESEIMASGPYNYYGEYQGDYYGPPGNYDYFLHGPPSSQAQSPADPNYLPGSGPGRLEGPLSGHHPSENQRSFNLHSIYWGKVCYWMKYNRIAQPAALCRSTSVALQIVLLGARLRG
ncbi:UNVERIFIED_CONTAM: hypothetical protein FKN15_048192 [Acipenser sinensis]